MRTTLTTLAGSLALSLACGGGRVDTASFRLAPVPAPVAPVAPAPDGGSWYDAAWTERGLAVGGEPIEPQSYDKALATVPQGRTPADVLEELGRQIEELGYRRVWLPGPANESTWVRGSDTLVVTRPYDDAAREVVVTVGSWTPEPIEGEPGWADPGDAQGALGEPVRCGAVIDGLTFDPMGTVEGMVMDGGGLSPHPASDDPEIREVKGVWRFEGETLVVDATVAGGEPLGLVLDPVRAHVYRGHVYVGSPERTLGCSSLGGYTRAFEVEVWPAGAGPDGVAAAGEIAGRALDDGEGFVKLGPDAANPRKGVEVLYRSASVDKAREIASVLGRDLPGVAVSVKEWPGATADVVIAVGTEVGRAQLSGVVQLTLHGNTPVLAWSPDSERLAANASFTAEYFLDDHQQTLGVWVIEPATGTQTRIARQPAYHPTWVGDRVLFNAGQMEAGEQAGLWLAGLDGTVAMVGAMREQYESNPYFSPQGTVPGRDGTALVYFDYGHDQPGWYRYEPAADRFEFQSAGVETSGWAGASWRPPDEGVTQCDQEAGGARIAMDGDRFTVHLDGEVVAISGPPLHRYRNSTHDGFCDEEPHHCGPIRPCLSPDGAWVAWVSRGIQPQVYDVNVLPLK